MTERNSLRERLVTLSPDEQERCVLETMTSFNGLTRDWFAVELREAFDRVVEKGWISPETTYHLTAAGSTRILGERMPESKDD